MHTVDFTIFSLDLNFVRCLVTCPLSLWVYKRETLASIEKIWRISHQNALANFLIWRSRALPHRVIVYEIILAGFKFGD